MKNRTNIIATFILGLAVFFTGCAGPKVTAGIDDIAAASGTEAIVVTLPEATADDPYATAARALQAEGFPLQMTDERIGTLSTGFTGVAQRWGTDYIHMKVDVVTNSEAGTVTLRGQWRTSGDEGTAQTVRKGGQNGSPKREAWKALHQLADSFGGSISYR